MQRRQWLAGTAAGLATAPWLGALQAGAAGGSSPYGPPGTADVHGIALPPGFSARLVARSGRAVGGSGPVWHFAPGSGACFGTPEGGWVYVSNAELPRGGAAALKFDAAGGLVEAYPILDGTRVNGGGAATPWGTWLSCEAFDRGQVWECDPLQPGQGVARPALGRFAHAAVAVDPATGTAYLTEAEDDGSRLYRFRPYVPGDLSAGVLEAARVGADGGVGWTRVSPLNPHRGDDSTAFQRGEGAGFADGIVHGPSGDVFVAGGDQQLVLLADASGRRIAAPFLQLVGHARSAVTGAAFSPDGSRLHFSSQRGTGGRDLGPGMTFEVSGPFRQR